MTNTTQQFGKLLEIGQKWQQTQKSADAVLDRVSSNFADLDLDIEVLDKKSFCECKKSNGNGGYVESIYDLSYGRSDDGQRGLCVRHYEHCLGQHEASETEESAAQPQLELAGVRLLADLSPELRQKALMRLPAFIDLLSAELERRNQELEKATAQLEAVLAQTESEKSVTPAATTTNNTKSTEAQGSKKKDHA